MQSAVGSGSRRDGGFFCDLCTNRFDLIIIIEQERKPFYQFYKVFMEDRDKML